MNDNVAPEAKFLEVGYHLVAAEQELARLLSLLETETVNPDKNFYDKLRYQAWWGFHNLWCVINDARLEYEARHPDYQGGEQ